jgi:hypothetical protein
MELEFGLKTRTRLNAGGGPLRQGNTAIYSTQEGTSERLPSLG